MLNNICVEVAVSSYRFEIGANVVGLWTGMVQRILAQALFALSVCGRHSDLDWVAGTSLRELPRQFRALGR